MKKKDTRYKSNVTKQKHKYKNHYNLPILELKKAYHKVDFIHISIFIFELTIKYECDIIFCICK